MTPKEKAKELVSNIGKTIGIELKNGGFRYNIEKAKQCALIVVDEIINEFYTHPIAKIYWEEVKTEIVKL